MRQDIGPSVAERTFQMLLPSGETVLAQERFLLCILTMKRSAPKHGAIMNGSSSMTITGGRLTIWKKQLTLFFLKIYPRSSPSLKRPTAN